MGDRYSSVELIYACLVILFSAFHFFFFFGLSGDIGHSIMKTLNDSNKTHKLKFRISNTELPTEYCVLGR